MTLQDRVIAVIKQNTDTKVDINLETNLETNLVDDLGIDSFDLLMIVSGIEEEFGITVDAEDFIDVKLVSDIVNKLSMELGRI